jgi:cell wall-associated NlpC family hydrolase
MCVVVPIADTADAHAARYGSRPLARPMHGKDVKVLQQLLNQWGLSTTVDGAFGRRTTSRVRSWERHSNRRINGRMNRREQSLLQAAVARGEHIDGWTPAPALAPAPTSTTPGAKATIASDGRAIAPASAPQVVKEIIAAGNEIFDKPYKYGGGHGQWRDTGYDCSGSMSYALHGAGLLDTSMDSTGFMSWGDRGKGTWVTTYANSGHSYMIVAGLRFDTSGLDQDGSRWHTSMRTSTGYTVRHPSGL